MAGGQRAKGRLITDFGRSYDVRATDSKGRTSGPEIHLPRYAVWWDDPQRGKLQVLTSGDDLVALQAEYGPGLPVVLTDPGRGQRATVRSTVCGIEAAAFLNEHPLSGRAAWEYIVDLSAERGCNPEAVRAFVVERLYDSGAARALEAAGSSKGSRNMFGLFNRRGRRNSAPWDDRGTLSRAHPFWEKHRSPKEVGQGMLRYIPQVNYAQDPEGFESDTGLYWRSQPLPPEGGWPKRDWPKKERRARKKKKNPYAKVGPSKHKCPPGYKALRVAGSRRADGGFTRAHWRCVNKKSVKLADDQDWPARKKKRTLPLALTRKEIEARREAGARPRPTARIKAAFKRQMAGKASAKDKALVKKYNDKVREYRGKDLPQGRRAITTRQRRRMPQSEFALPITAQSREFKDTHPKFAGAYPMEDRSHGANARGRAIQMLNSGHLSLKEARTIFARTSAKWGFEEKDIVQVDGRWESVPVGAAPRRAAANRRTRRRGPSSREDVLFDAILSGE